MTGRLAVDMGWPLFWHDLPDGPLAPFRSPGFRWLWCSSLATAVAQGMERTATAWLALSSLELGGGAFAVGLVLAARMLPLLVLGLAAGTIADQTNRSRQLFIVDENRVEIHGVRVRPGHVRRA